MTTQDCPPVIPLEPTEPVSSEEQSSEAGDNAAEPSPRPRAVGKIKTMVDNDIFQVIPPEMESQGRTPFEKNVSPSLSGVEWQDYKNIGDRLRFEARSFWGRRDTNGDTEEPNVGQFQYINFGLFERQNRNRFVEYLPFKIQRLGEPENWTPQDSSELLSDFYTKQSISVEAQEYHFSVKSGDSNLFVKRLWEIWIQGGTVHPHLIGGAQVTLDPLFDTSKKFFDHSYRVTAPMFPRELKKINSLNKPAMASIESEYNFRVAHYEIALASILNFGPQNEALLPNMYVMLLEKKSRNLDSDNSIYNRHINLERNIDDVFVDILDSNNKRVGEEDSGQYFDKWGKAYRNIKRPAAVTRLRNLYGRLFMSPSDIDILKSFNDRRFLYPMYNDIQFSTDRRSILADSVKEAQLTTSLMKAASQPARLVNPPHAPRVKSFTTATQTISTQGQPVITTDLIRNKDRKILDIIAWWSKFKDTYETDDIESVMLSSSLPEIFVTQDPQYKFVKTILSLIFSGKLREILKNRMRTFEDIMNGKHAYSETMFYKIAKHKVNSTTRQIEGSPIQEFFVPNSSELDIFRYIDTQVVYNKEYKYIIYAYEAVFGTEYEYKADPRYPDFVRNETSTARVTVYMKPSIKLIETPLASMSAVVIDKPPLPPDVNIIPYKGIHDKILFNINSVIGEDTAQPIVFSRAEADLISRIRSANDLLADDPIEYKADDVPKAIEIYRTTFKPERYTDFIGALHNTVQTDLGEAASDDFNQDAESFFLPAVSYVDDILPNVKYYYMFRAIDLRGNFSNPSPVYLAEMVSKDGVVFPRIQVIDMEPKEKPTPTKAVKKYIKISPSQLQGLVEIQNIDSIESAKDAEVRIGDVEDSLFVKYPNKNKIKLRVTSKQTGKKIDINLNFVHIHNT